VGRTSYKESTLNYLSLILFFILNSSLHADTTVLSQFGFTATLPNGWFVISPKDIANANANETAKSLGIPASVDQSVINEILAKLKNKNIEFYYDQNYIKKEYKNHISAQLSAPLIFKSLDEVKKECDGVPNQLKELFGEPVNLHSCQLVPSNGRPIFHHAYTVNSQNLTIINEIVPVNQKYSITFVGGSANDTDGLRRLRKAQQSLVDAVTSYLKKQAK